MSSSMISKLKSGTPLATAVVESRTDKVNGKTGSNASSPYTYGSVCLLCLKTKTCTSVKSDPEKHRQSQLTCIKYVVLVSKYLKLDTELTKVSHKRYFNSSGEIKLCENDNDASFKEEISKFVVCDLCLPLAESFCDTYQKYELIRMKLEAKIVESTICVQKSEGLGDSLKVIRGIKHRKGSGPESVHQDENTLIDFRTELKKRGSKLVQLNGPKVILEREKKAEELVQKKMQKLLYGNSENSTSCSKNYPSPDSGIKNAVEKTSPAKPSLSPSIKIVRKASGTQSEVNIIRIPDKPMKVENNNDNDIEVINIVRKKNTAKRSSSSSNVPNSTPIVQESTTFIQPPPVASATVLRNPTVFEPANSVQPHLQFNVHSQNGPMQVVVPAPTQQTMLPLPIHIQRCNINGCGLTFPKTEQGLLDTQRHLNTHGGLVCSICSSVLGTPFELISHELKHQETNPNRQFQQGFQCTRCPHFAMFRTDHQEHFFERHLNSKIELLKCLICKKGFSHLKHKQYQTHIANCHPRDDQDDLSECHSCMICRVYFKKKGTLWKHFKIDHRINCKDGPHKCPHCPQSFFFHRLKELHMEFSCENREQHKCLYPGCLSTFPRLELVQRHFEQTHNNNLLIPECPICKCTFQDMNSLKDHVQTHNGEQVKLVFSGENNQEAQVIPVPVETNVPVPASTLANPVISMNSLPLFSQQPDYANGYYDMSSNAQNTMPLIGIAPPFPLPIPPEPLQQTPMIISVSGAPQNFVSVPSFSSSSSVPSNQNRTSTGQVQNGGVVQADEVESKLLEMFFDESNDSGEELMEFLGNVVSNDGGEDELPPPDEDPFAWMLSEEFDTS